MSRNECNDEKVKFISHNSSEKIQNRTHNTYHKSKLAKSLQLSVDLHSCETTLYWWLGAVSMAAVSLATLLGNAAVLIALLRLKRAPAHYPLASLATADLLVGVFVLPVAAARELFVFHWNWALCACWSTLDVLCCTASILSICLLGWERWWGITAPLARAKRAERARLYAALIWPAAAAVAVPTAFIPSPVHYLPGEIPKACTVNINVGYVFVSTFFSFYLPACLMVMMYVRILHALAAPPPMLIRAHRGRIPCNGKPSPNKEIPNNTPASLKQNMKKITVDCIHDRQRRATRTIIMLMALFLVCWTPFFVMLPLDSLCKCVWEVAWQWCSWLGYINSAMNPFVYAAASPSIRQALHTSFSISGRSTDLPSSSGVRQP